MQTAHNQPLPTKPGETILFSDHPEFTPNLTPRQLFRLGSFGGTYWRPIISAVNSKHYKDQHLEFANLETIDYDENGKEYNTKWWDGINEKLLISADCNVELNNYSVAASTSLLCWESREWIVSQDPYGWVQWYCRFYSGRRSNDDRRQISRWLAFAGPKGRFRKRLIGMCKNKRKSYDDKKVSPVIRQGLQHWAYILTSDDAK